MHRSLRYLVLHSYRGNAYGKHNRELVYIFVAKSQRMKVKTDLFVFKLLLYHKAIEKNTVTRSVSREKLQQQQNRNNF